MSDSDSVSLSDRAEVEWHPNADPPVYVIRQFNDNGWKSEVYLTPEEAKTLSAYISKRKTVQEVSSDE